VTGVATFSATPVITNTGSAALTLKATSATPHYGYLVHDGTYISLASDEGATGIKLRINKAAADNTLDVTTTGLLLTGTLGVTGNISGSGTASWLSRSGATTAAVYQRTQNTSGDLIMGVESSTGGAILTGAAAYSSFVMSNAGTFNIGANGTLAAVFTGANTALQGTLGVTGLLTASVGAQFAGQSTPASGAGVEINYSGGIGNINAVNRTGSAWLPVVLGGLTADIKISGSTVVGVTSTGASVTGTLGVTGYADAATLRGTGTSFPTTGTGVEIGVAGGNGYIQSYNRTGAAYVPIQLIGSTIDLFIGASSKLVISAAGAVTIPGTLGVTGKTTIGAGVNFNVGAATSSRGTTDPTNAVSIAAGVAPVGAGSGGTECCFYNTAGEMRVMDGAGNATLLSPHNKEGDWIYDSVSPVTGKHLQIDMEKMMKAINEKFGWDFVHEFTI
jgi:hypothetical protein